MFRRKEPPYLLTVLSGPNAGAEVGLSGARKSLGSGPKQDIQLDGVPVEAFRFMMERERLTVRPRKGVDVATRDGTVLKPGRSHKLRLPVQLTVGGVALHVCRLERRPGVLAQLLAPAMVLAFTFALFVIGPHLAGAGQGAASAARQPMAMPVVEAPEPALPAAVQAAPCDGPCAPLAEAALRTMLEDAGLDGVDPVADGGILRVEIPAALAGDRRWSEVRQAYDIAWAGRVPILLERAGPVPEAPFTVQSVWLGPRPEVTTRKGETYRVGSAVPGGWTVEAIRAGSVDLTSDRGAIRIEF